MSDIENGLAEFAEELKQLSDKITDDNVRRKALEAGAKPIVDRAKRIINSHRRTGRLEQSIAHAYNENGKEQEIGWGGEDNTTKSTTGFYGRFLEKGYKPVTGKRKGGKLIGKKPSGKFIRIEHIKPAYEAEKETVSNAMLEVYKQEIGG